MSRLMLLIGNAVAGMGLALMLIGGIGWLLSWIGDEPRPAAARLNDNQEEGHEHDDTDH